MKKEKKDLTQANTAVKSKSDIMGRIYVCNNHRSDLFMWF